MEDHRKRRYMKLAFELGDAIKYEASVNEINRAAKGILGLDEAKDHDEPSITSSRAQVVYNWVMTLYQATIPPEPEMVELAEMNPLDAIMAVETAHEEGLYPPLGYGLQPGVALIASEEAEERLKELICELVPAESAERQGLLRMLKPTKVGGGSPLDFADLHQHVQQVAGQLYADGHYDQAVFTAFKTIEIVVREKTGLQKIGQDLMHTAFNVKKPSLIVAELSTQEGRNRQEGVQFLCAGAMRGIRNVEGHGHLQLSPTEAMEHLAFASLLARIVEAARVVSDS